MFPLEEIVDRPFFVDIVLDSLKKKLIQIQKDLLLQLDTSGIFMSIPASTFRTVFEEWRSWLLRCSEAGGEWL
jgi:hypothetical protein